MPKRIEPADVLVGQRVRAYRLARRMSQSALAEEVGVTFQQIQKYEKGTNRIGSGRLQNVAAVLGVGIGAFFAEGKSDQSGHDPLTEILSQPYAARLLTAFGAIDEVKLRLALVKLAEGLGERTE
jgi:transcriptional regulator with XRE-family HTH domain